MKKISYLLLGFLGMMAVACEDSLEPSTPQVNPQNPILADGDIVVAPYGVLASDQVITLATYDDPDNTKIEVLKLEKAESLVSNATIILSLEISNTADFAKYQSLELTPYPDDPTVFYADSYAWNTLQLEVCGNSVKPQEIYYRVPVLVNIENTDYRYMGPDYYATTGTAKVTRMDPGYQIDENYYVFGAFIGGNTPATGVAMTHDDRDVYDNPRFTYAFNVTADQVAVGYTILIAPEAVHAQGGTPEQCYGMGEEEGTLAIGGQPITVNEEGPHMLEINVLDLTYSVKIAPNSLYVMYSGGKFEDVAQLGSSDFVTFEGMAGILNKWVLTGQSNYKPTLYVANPDVEETVDGSLASGALMFSADGATGANDYGIPYGGRAGLFYVTANLSTLKYTRYYVSSLGFVGSINNWGNKNDDGSVTPDVPLYGMNANGGATTTANGSRSTLFMNWIGTLTVKEGDEWKIRANSEWTVDFGGAGSGNFATDGTPVVLSKGGDNFIATEDGTYTVKVYFKRQYDSTEKAMTPYYMEVTPVAE